MEVLDLASVVKCWSTYERIVNFCDGVKLFQIHVYLKVRIKQFVPIGRSEIYHIVRIKDINKLGITYNECICRSPFS